MKIALLYNPVSGRGAAVAVARTVAARLEALGHSVVEGRSECAGHIEQMSVRYGGSVERVLVLGGDGSLREAARGLLKLTAAGRAALGILPFGSGNVVARELALPLDPLEALEVIVAAGPMPYDVGLAAADGAAPEPFLGMAGIGFDAAIAAGIARLRGGRFGSRWYRWNADTLYAALAAREVLRFGVPRFSVSAEGAVAEQRACAAIVSNGATYGKGMRMSPLARASDGLLDLHVRRSSAPWTTLTSHFQAQRRRDSPAWAARYLRAESLQIEALARANAGDGAAFPWHLDGDAMGTARSLSITIAPGALDLIVPAAAPPR